MAQELALWAGLYGVYLLVRGQTIAGLGEALANARRVVEVERLTGLDQERLIQDASQGLGFLDELLARYYELGFFPVVIAGLVVLAHRDRDRYRELRTAMLVAIGAATVSSRCSRPPRRGSSGPRPDGHRRHERARHRQPLRRAYNPYAAMPSMHVGWTLLLAIGLYGIAHGVARVVVVAHPAIMTVAVVATGNHYLLDALAGATIALVALALVRWAHARRNAVLLGGGGGPPHGHTLRRLHYPAGPDGDRRLHFAEVAPGSGAAGAEQRLRELIEQIELADQVGLDVFGVGEHHRPDFAVSAPAVVLAAAATRTRRIRLTSAVSVLSSDDPVRVFQEFATLDLLSGGRAEIMAGRGSFIESFPLFG